MFMSKLRETIHMIVDRFPEIITLSTNKEVVNNKSDDYLLTIMRSNVSLSGELVFVNVDKSVAITMTLLIEKLYDLYMDGKDTTAMCNLIQERIRGD